MVQFPGETALVNGGSAGTGLLVVRISADAGAHALIVVQCSERPNDVAAERVCVIIARKQRRRSGPVVAAPLHSVVGAEPVPRSAPHENAAPASALRATNEVPTPARHRARHLRRLRTIGGSQG